MVVSKLAKIWKEKKQSMEEQISHHKMTNFKKLNMDISDFLVPDLTIYCCYNQQVLNNPKWINLKQLESKLSFSTNIYFFANQYLSHAAK